MPKLKDCINSAGQLRKDFPSEKLSSMADKLEKEGMPEKQAARQALTEYHKELHDELNEAKDYFKIPKDKYEPFDATKKVNEINAKYEKATQETEKPNGERVEGRTTENEPITAEVSGNSEAAVDKVQRKAEAKESPVAERKVYVDTIAKLKEKGDANSLAEAADLQKNVDVIDKFKMGMGDLIAQLREKGILTSECL